MQMLSAIPTAVHQWWPNLILRPCAHGCTKRRKNMNSPCITCMLGVEMSAVGLKLSLCHFPLCKENLFCTKQMHGWKCLCSICKNYEATVSSTFPSVAIIFKRPAATKTHKTHPWIAYITCLDSIIEIKHLHCRSEPFKGCILLLTKGGKVNDLSASGKTLTQTMNKENLIF